MSEDVETRPFHQRLPIGEVLDGDSLTEGDRAAFGSLTMAPLAPMLVPEQPRAGTLDLAACAHCRPSGHTIWHDDGWRVRAGLDRMGIPVWRGAVLALWEDVLPAMPGEMVREHLEVVAHALADQGGEAFPDPSHA